MSKEEILTKAIEKAIANGLDWNKLLGGTKGYTEHIDPRFYLDGWSVGAVYWLIFNHDFAKALWGDGWMPALEDIANGYPESEAQPDWQYHLQQMVIADDPIKYLGEHI